LKPVLGVLALCLLLLGGCGFTPLYGENDLGVSVTDEMAQIYVLPIPNRTGQVLYNELRDRIVPHGEPAAPKYVLAVRVAQSFQSTVIRPDATASRLNLILIATYLLFEAATKKVLTRGEAQSIGAWSVRVEPYPTLIARQDVQNRVSRDLSDEIRNRIALYFTGHGEAPTAAPPPPVFVPAPSPELGTGTLGTGTVETGVFGSPLPGQPGAPDQTTPGSGIYTQ
jgi:LPS-assembly lipoprotein